ncbi:MAG: ATP-binding protein, partial [Thiovulaceae bacterium]|nr:ATP-binding protein [Sulfurimonadaceae bacterium]
EDSPQKGLFDQPDFSALKDSLKTEGLDIKETIKLVSQVESDWKRQISNFQKVLSQYHALATLGGIVDKVLHDGRQPLATIQTEAGLGKELLEELLAESSSVISVEKSDASSIDTGFRKILDQASILRDVFRRIEPFGGRKRGRPKKYYIEEVIKDVFHNYRREIAESGISVDLPSTETLVSVDVTELSEIFTNLIVNSIYWLASVPKDSRFIRVLVSRIGEGELEILFSDSGPGVSPKYRELIFDPYFSTRPDGHGLGLCLVGEIVKDYYNGSVELMDTGKKGGAVFRIVMRKRV